LADTERGSLYHTLAALPKIELHRHLEGAIRLQTLAEVGQAYQLPVPATAAEALRPYVQIMPDSPHTIAHFLSKFDTLRRFYCSPEVIQRIAREAVADAAADNIQYMELRFTPKALSQLKGYPFKDVICWVCSAVRESQAQQGQQGRPIRVNLIVSVNRHESVSEAERCLRAVIDCGDPMLVAFDLAGKESGFTNEPFYGLFAEARQQGLHITVHAGEWAGPQNVQDAIVNMGARRIGHGVRVVEDNRVIKVAREHDATFEVCVTSNWQSGVVHQVNEHPLRDMGTLGLKTTINTDDPCVSDITLTDELHTAINVLGFTMDNMKQAILTAANSAFLPDAERQQLVSEFTHALYNPPA
jgi:adenosine deaminase